MSTYSMNGRSDLWPYETGPPLSVLRALATQASIECGGLSLQLAKPELSVTTA